MEGAGYEKRVMGALVVTPLFEKEPVDRASITEILDAARAAFSFDNKQPWEIIVIDDPLLLARVKRSHPMLLRISSAPVLLAIVTNPVLAPSTHMVDGGSLISYIVLSASVSGYAAYPVYVGDDAVLKSLLNVPPKLYLLAIIGIGRPRRIPLPLPRKPLASIVYYNKYGLRR